MIATRHDAPGLTGWPVRGALAVADVEPKMAARIVCEAVRSVPLAMRHYEPDGGGTEGVTYWGYGSRYNVVLLSSLATALGTDFGLSRVGAFKQSGFYQIYLSGAGRVAFDFADCGRKPVSEPQHFWMARTYAVLAKQHGRDPDFYEKHYRPAVTGLTRPTGRNKPSGD